jgi:zinc ribbon protein
MFCDACGTRLEESASFCPTCGKALRSAPLMPPAQGRITGHVRLLGILWLAMSAFHLIPALFMFAMFGRGLGFMPPGVPEFVHGILQTIGWVFLGGSIAGFITGWGLLDRQPWARMLAIVMGFLNLLHIPFGTALGIYTLWVLLPAQSEAEYRQVAGAA